MAEKRIEEALRHALADLETRIAVMERRAAKIRELLVDYEGEPTTPKRRPENAKNVGSRPGSTAGRIVTGAVAYLRSKGSRASSTEIAKALINMNVIKIGDDISPRLSRSSLFVGKRGKGYALAEWDDDD